MAASSAGTECDPGGRIVPMPMARQWRETCSGGVSPQPWKSSATSAQAMRYTTAGGCFRAVQT